METSTIKSVFKSTFDSKSIYKVIKIIHESAKKSIFIKLFSNLIMCQCHGYEEASKKPWWLLSGEERRPMGSKASGPTPYGPNILKTEHVTRALDRLTDQRNFSISFSSTVFIY